MGNTKGGGSGSWRQENVVSASYHTRPLALNMVKFIGKLMTFSLS
jgi:hypothetical protein